MVKLNSPGPSKLHPRTRNGVHMQDRQPGPAYGVSIFTHAQQGVPPAVSRLGALSHHPSRAEAQGSMDVSYFEELERPSPAAFAPPALVREYATPASSTRSSKVSTPAGPTPAGSLYSTQTPADSMYSTQTQLEQALQAEDYAKADDLKKQRDALAEKDAALRRAVEAQTRLHYQQLGACLTQLEQALRAEDYAKAAELKKQRGCSEGQTAAPASYMAPVRRVRSRRLTRTFTGRPAVVSIQHLDRGGREGGQDSLGVWRPRVPFRRMAAQP